MQISYILYKQHVTNVFDILFWLAISISYRLMLYLLILTRLELEY